MADDTPIPRRIEFDNGGVIDVRRVKDGWVYYQVWPPGIKEQGHFDRCFKKTVADWPISLAATQAQVAAEIAAGMAPARGETDAP